jgi:hypothetical protein
MKQPVRLVDQIGIVVQRTSAKLLATLQAVDPLITGVHYLYGHYPDIRERLLQLGKAESGKDKRYPLIVLFEDFRVLNKVLGLYGVGDIKLMILWPSGKAVTREQREASFKDILDPIYIEFFRQLKISGFFMQYGPFDHKRIDRPHWGDAAIYGNKGYLFDEILDGIEISDLQLKTYYNNCVIA